MGFNNKEFKISSRGQCLSILRGLIVSVSLLPSVLVLAAAPPAPTPDGAEFRLNQYTTNEQSWPDVNYAPDGSFVATWISRFQDGSGYGVYGRCYNADGTLKRDEFLIPTYITNDQSKPAVEVAPDGSFVVAWHSNGPDGNGWGVFMQRFDKSCNAIGTETQVNTYTNSTQSEPRIAFALDGHFVIVWHSHGQDGSSYGTYGQLFNADGTPRGSEFHVSTSTAGEQTWPDVGMDAEGNFTVTWRDQYADGSSWGVFAQRYAADGSTIGGQFRVNTYTSSEQRDVTIGMAPDGRHVMVWHSYFQDGNLWGVYGQLYNADGSTNGSEFRVNSTTTGHQVWPNVSMAVDGSFVVSWMSSQEVSGYGIYAKRYSALGQALTSDFRVNTYTTSDQNNSSTSVGTDGRILIAWHSNGQDTSSWGVYAQRYLGAGGSVDLGLTVSNNTDFAAPAGIINYSVDVNNAGPDTAWYSALTAILPAGFGIDSYTGAGWVCNLVGQELTCINLELASGATSTLNLNLSTAVDSGTMDVWPAITFDLQSSLLTDANQGNNLVLTDLSMVDLDNDGIANTLDNDKDGDGYPNSSDAFPYDVTEWLDTDNDGIGNNADPDDDNDGVIDGADAFPLDPTETIDTDGDGIGNNADPNDDNDQRDDDTDACPLDPNEIFDTDGDGICNNADPDDDNDGILDVDEVTFVGPSNTRSSDSSGIGSLDFILLLSMTGLLTVRRGRRKI
ncbi:MAG: DUF11 domain-containing protein [Gammaproteobacteria bacterium]|nr:DUF11 domain-containing protein [Gammaproteobacteria bacterium]